MHCIHAVDWTKKMMYLREVFPKDHKIEEDGTKMGFFEKLKKIFVGFMSFLVVSLMASYSIMPKEAGGIELNGLIALLLWIVFIFLIVKGHPFISGLFSVATYIALKIFKFGIESENADALIVLFGRAAIFVFIMYLLFKWFSDSAKASEEKNKRIRENRKAGKAYCDRCGSTSLQYYSMGIPYRDFDGRIRYSSQKYHCNNCGSEW